MTMRQAVESFDDFARAALEHFEAAGGDEAAFINGDTFKEALTRWWIDVVHLEVTGPDTYQWICPGCQQRAGATAVPLYRLPLFDYPLWEFCERCGVNS